jgi:hypothetical protein
MMIVIGGLTRRVFPAALMMMTCVKVKDILTEDALRASVMSA